MCSRVHEHDPCGQDAGDRVIEPLSLGTSIVALGVSGVAAWTALSVAKRQAHELGRALLHDLTSGEVAAARNRIGTFMYGPRTSVRELTEATMVRDYYTLLWCIERAGAGQQALRGWTAKNASEDFMNRVRWHAQEIATNASLLHSVFDDYDDAEAWAAFLRSARVLAFEPMTDTKLAEGVEVRQLDERRAILG